VALAVWLFDASHFVGHGGLWEMAIFLSVAFLFGLLDSLQVGWLDPQRRR
jgi:hypothetical protein